MKIICLLGAAAISVGFRSVCQSQGKNINLREKKANAIFVYLFAMIITPVGRWILSAGKTCQGLCILLPSAHKEESRVDAEMGTCSQFRGLAGGEGLVVTNNYFPPGFTVVLEGQSYLRTKGCHFPVGDRESPAFASSCLQPAANQLPSERKFCPQTAM